MELTIEQALQQGVTAHKEGKLKDAERLYRAILQSQPAHPDANHNLGVIAVSVNKADAALPLFKTALEANPKIEQFWLSYIDALIKEKQFDNAKPVLEQARMAGLGGGKVDVLEAQLKQMTQSALPKSPEKKKSLTLKEKRKKIAASKQQKKQTKGKNTNSLSPSQSVMDNLLEYCQNGRYNEAEKLAVTITQRFPKYQFGWKALGVVFEATGKKSEAINANQKSVSLAPKDTEAHYNLGNTLKELGKLDKAVASYMQAIVLKPDYAEAHMNLGSTLKELGRLEEAETSFTQAIALKPDHAEAHCNLGNTLKELGRLEEAETSLTQAIALKPDHAGFHLTLGATLQELGKLNEAEASYTQTIALKPDYAEAHSNLGITLKELGRLEEAEASLRQAIVFDPDSAIAHYFLGRVLFNMGYNNLALESIEKANHIDPQSRETKLILSVLKSRRSSEESETVIGDVSKVSAFRGLTSNLVILNRVVEEELISYIYGMSSRALNETKDARYGSGTCSSDFNLFEDGSSIIQKTAEDLTRIMMEAVKSDVYIFDSFFNILGAGGGSTPHRHLNNLDKDIGLNLGNKKFSLVYYISVGDQNCSEPGVLKLYEPVEDILPCDGMITIISASRKHSAVYDGKTDRIMIGANFYSL